MKKFKNISGKDLTIPEVGIIKAGETKRLKDDFRNANFEEVFEEKKEEKEPAKKAKK